jgi:hypothetical protein
MAKRDENPQITPPDETPQDAKAPATKAEPPSDVLVYIDREGAIVCSWNEAPVGVADRRVMIPAQSAVRLEPGLSFCPGSAWPVVSGTPSYRHGVTAGRIKAVAGTRQGLADDWARCKAPAIREWLAKTYGVEVLLRLQAMEQDGPARDDVLDAIADRLDTMKVKVAAHDVKRRAARRANRRR